jgi:hypothetical protein
MVVTPNAQPTKQKSNKAVVHSWKQNINAPNLHRSCRQSSDWSLASLTTPLQLKPSRMESIKSPRAKGMDKYTAKYLAQSKMPESIKQKGYCSTNIPVPKHVK